MMHGFTVIQGGQAVPDAAAIGHPVARASEEAASNGHAASRWRVDLHRAGTVDDDAVAAWRALMTRSAITDPRVDPDYVLSAARHQSGGRTIAFALAWDRDGNGRAALHGVMPMAMPHPIWGRGRADLWQPPGLPDPAAALIDGSRAEAVEAAVRGRLAGLRRPLRLGAPTRLPTQGGASRPVLAATHEGRRRTIPADCVIGVRAGDDAAAEVEQVSAPGLILSAVEEFLALDARHAARPIIADPSEASMVRVVTRLFARRGQMRIELARRAGELVAGTLHLGAGARAVVWRRAARV